MSTLPAEEPACREPENRAVELVIEGRPRPVGTLSVSRLLPSRQRRMIGPFIFLDHAGPVTIPPGAGFDVPPHPHIGLSTVTYFLAGENVHRDSLGTVQVNRPGEINLMTAGRGIVHSERAEPAFRAAGGVMHMVQMWLALRDDHEDDEPSFEHHAELPAIAPAPGVRGRVLMGEAFGTRSPIRHASEPLLVELELAAGSSVAITDEAPERGVLVIDGAIDLAGEPLARDRIAVLCPGAVTATATEATRLLVLGGPPVGARFIEWNFVASSRARIESARDRWKAREFPAIPGDDDELVPWPGN